MNNKKNILITGGAGFIGSNLAQKLINDDHNVISIDNYSFGKKENEVKNVKYINDDIANISAYDESIDICFHLAAKARVQPSFDDPVDYFRVNAEGTMKVAEWAVKNNIKVVYAGEITAAATAPNISAFRSCLLAAPEAFRFQILMMDLV